MDISLLVVIGVIAITFIIYQAVQQQNKLNRLKEEYEIALSGTDRRAALEAGRAYYIARRGDGSLTAVDEQAIANDLNTMSQQVHTV